MEQILLDAEEANDWALVFAIDLERFALEWRPVPDLLRVDGGAIVG